MQNPSHPWTIYVLHHSHTDIGYTARQELISRQHADFLRQVLWILRRIDAGEAPEQRGFRWQCENWWQIENFLHYADRADREDLIRYILEGSVGLSASYLNLTDLIDETVLREHLAQAQAWAQKNQLPMNSAMTADVNGYSAAWPDLLADAGVRYFYSALHTHHGMYPLHRNPTFFRWRGSGGKSVLTFVGEHYHWGHVLGLCPHGTSSFMLDDDFLRDIDRGKLFSTDAETTENEELDLAVQRITRYLTGLEASGWPLPFIPVFVSGILSDNAPPNGRIAERISRLNRRFEGRIILNMTTLDDFFEKLENAGADIPEYAGDWTDWWADGVGSTPETVKLYREAQRRRNLAALLSPSQARNHPLWQASGRNLMMYAEHTWGHSASVSDPYSSLVSAMNLKKAGYAIQAHGEAAALLDGVLETLGNRAPHPDRPGIFRVLNPFPFPLTAPVAALLLWWEYPDGLAQREEAFALQDQQTRKTLCAQTSRGPRGRLVETVLTLAPGESRELRIVRPEPNREMPPHTPGMCADAITDQAGLSGLVLPEIIETDDFLLRTDAVRGISSIREKKTSWELVDPARPYGVFTCLYMITPAAGPQTSARRKMGRRRETVNTRTSMAHPLQFSIAEQGDVSITLKIVYSLEGSDECILFLKLFRHFPRMEARIRLKKRSVADAEEIQLTLPLRTDGSNETWIDKTGCVIRPGLDQLPGTCEAFWCLQNGILRRGNAFDLLITCPDTPLVSFGEGQKGPVALCDGKNTALNHSEIRSRIMNNYWETNFSVDLGGWHEFRYILTLEKPLDPASFPARCAALSVGFPLLEL